jgi:acetylornithine deacetylase/succinyl-diaminopimelate desuccinylase-like protein
VNTSAITSFVDAAWEQHIVPALIDYIRIPNQSPLFDADWEAHGHMDRAVDLISGWCRDHALPGMTLEVVRLPGRTPLIYIEVPGASDRTVLLYGHLDKQPPMTGWDEDLGPWTPVLRDGRLYGRGGADDGYAAFASLTALAALAREGIPHARCVVLIEACEESGSLDLPAYIEELAPRIGTPDLVVCLDSGCGNYEQLWSTTSLRGVLVGTLEISTLTEGVHSGDAGGIVPETFTVAREVIGRIEDGPTGRIVLPELQVDIPAERREQAVVAAAALGDRVAGKFPFVAGTRPLTADPVEQVLNRTWRPAMAVTGCKGLPPIEVAGNVLRPTTEFQLSIRIPPMCDADTATQAVKAELERDPPHGCSVTFHAHEAAGGWNAPELAPWLAAAMDRASMDYFDKPACAMGEGGTIPFMGMLGERFPQAQFLITGVLGPHSNAHGPNEFLELATARRLTSCVASVIADHHREFSRT